MTTYNKEKDMKAKSWHDSCADMLDKPLDQIKGKMDSLLLEGNFKEFVKLSKLYSDVVCLQYQLRIERVPLLLEERQE